jgi:predicted SAM-dependent methyltransferase
LIFLLGWLRRSKELHADGVREPSDGAVSAIDMNLRWIIHEKVWTLPLPAPVVQAMRHVLNRRVPSHNLFQVEVTNKLGLEIGGPSSIFSDTGELPIYRYVAGLDNCVFSTETIWEGKRAEGPTFLYERGKEKGFNFIREATDLHDIADRAYHFVLSSHSLEHIANPIKALKEWTRVAKPHGAIIVILPDYRRTFDHRRSPTTVEHMLQDYERGTDERDVTHLAEMLELHELTLDPAAGTKENFQKRSLLSFENRCLHHHVFDERNSRELLEAAGLSVEIQEIVKPHHIVLLARCP